MECRLEEGSLPACGLAHLPRSLLCSRWYQAQKRIQGTKTKTCSMQGMLESLKRYCSLVPRLFPSLIPRLLPSLILTLLPSICHILYEVPGYVTITDKEPGNEARRTVA